MREHSERCDLCGKLEAVGEHAHHPPGWWWFTACTEKLDGGGLTNLSVCATLCPECQKKPLSELLGLLATTQRRRNWVDWQRANDWPALETDEQAAMRLEAQALVREVEEGLDG